MEQHKKLFGEKVTKKYKKALPKLQRLINLEAKHIATKINLSNRIEKLAGTSAYATLKDHEDSFRSNPSLCLINASKCEVGIVYKYFLENINENLLFHLKYNQWRNTSQFIHWFSNINEK